MYKVKDSILEQLKKVPQEPGVYLMKDAFGKIIYVGKAKRLRNRLSSYFHGVDKHPNKTKKLVVNTVEFDYIIVNSETEAFLLEANLIKRNQPKFNILLKDDKSYPIIMITDEEYPRLVRVRKVEGKGRFFGPFTSGYDVNLVIEALKNIYPIRRCDVPLHTMKRPCLYYHMGKCLGPCTGKDVHEEYDAHIEKMIEFFQGNRQPVIKALEQRRDEAAQGLNFELAIQYRDQLEAVKNLTYYQKVTDVRLDNRDYVGLARLDEDICITVFIRRDGKIIERENHVFDNLIEETDAEIIEEFLTQYYQEANFIPNEIVIPGVPNISLLEDYFRQLAGHKVRLTEPKRGEKRDTLVLVQKNAQEYLAKFTDRIRQEQKRNEEIGIILSSIVSLDDIQRIEAYDISNIFGYMSVASMVVFEDYKKKPSDYRKFRIKHVKGPDDYHSMKEVLTRRLHRLQEEGFGKRPDLILVDGGKNQVGAATSVLSELGLSIPVIGMVKDDRHRTDGLFFEDHFIKLDRSTNIYRFFYQIQEEVHRFALSYHQKLRGKSLAFSVLDDIPHIGPVRKRKLLEHFGTIDGIMKASLEELIEVEGLDTRAAQAVFDHFN